MAHNNNGFNAMLTTSKGTRLAKYARGMGMTVYAEYQDYIEVGITSQGSDALFVCFDFKDIRTAYNISFSNNQLKDTTP